MALCQPMKIHCNQCPEKGATPSKRSGRQAICEFMISKAANAGFPRGFAAPLGARRPVS